VDIVRPLALGSVPEHLLRDVALLAVFGLVCYYVALVLTRRRLLR
jgi:hypothetical protein